MAIRRVTEEDIPWLHEVCAKAYPKGYYDAAASEKWVRGMIARPDHFLQRGERAWMAVAVYRLPYNPQVKIAGLLPLASLGNARSELLAMTASAIEWARGEGAKEFHWSAPTGADLGPLAIPFGAKPESPAYVLEL